MRTVADLPFGRDAFETIAQLQCFVLPSLAMNAVDLKQEEETYHAEEGKVLFPEGHVHSKARR